MEVYTEVATAHICQAEPAENGFQQIPAGSASAERLMREAAQRLFIIYKGMQPKKRSKEQDVASAEASETPATSAFIVDTSCMSVALCTARVHFSTHRA